MTKEILKTLPDDLFAALEPVFVAAKSNLERDGSLVPFAFVGGSKPKPAEFVQNTKPGSYSQSIPAKMASRSMGGPLSRNA